MQVIVRNSRTLAELFELRPEIWEAERVHDVTVTVFSARGACRCRWGPCVATSAAGVLFSIVTVTVIVTTTATATAAAIAIVAAAVAGDTAGPTRTATTTTTFHGGDCCRRLVLCFIFFFLNALGPLALAKGLHLLHCTTPSARKDASLLLQLEALEAPLRAAWMTIARWVRPS